MEVAGPHSYQDKATAGERSGDPVHCLPVMAGRVPAICASTDGVDGRNCALPYQAHTSRERSAAAVTDIVMWPAQAAWALKSGEGRRGCYLFVIAGLVPALHDS